MNGIIVIDKEMDYTSHDVVAIVKGILKEKHLGHTGTLDPNATGVLPVCIGPCTRLIEYMDEAPKKYRASAKFGTVTDTQDIWGTVVEEHEYHPISKEQLSEAVSHYIGNIQQVPSKYSAIRVNGRHLYSYAHSNEDVEIPVRNVTVYSIEILDFSSETGDFSIEVTCSRGTYVRSIINDIGSELGFGAVMTSLRRTSACGYTEADAIKLSELKAMSPDEIEKIFRPAEMAVAHMNRADINEQQRIDFANGKHLKVQQKEMSFDDPVCIFFEEKLIGIGKWDNPNRIKPVKVFVRND